MLIFGKFIYKIEEKLSLLCMKRIILLHFLILDNAIQLCARINNFQIGKEMSLQSGGLLTLDGPTLKLHFLILWVGKFRFYDHTGDILTKFENSTQKYNLRNKI